MTVPEMRTKADTYAQYAVGRLDFCQISFGNKITSIIGMLHKDRDGEEMDWGEFVAYSTATRPN